MVHSAPPSGGKGLSASVSGYSRSLMNGDAGLADTCEQDSRTDSALHSFATSTSGQQPANPIAASTRRPLPHSLATIISAASQTVKTGWFWYSIVASLCWTAWAFTARLGSKEIPPATMQFVSAFGFLLVGLVLVVVRKPQLKNSLRGNAYALISGVLLGLGGVALYGAYRVGENASVVTATTSLYPVVTVLLAVTFLREKLNKVQIIGVGFAMVAILLLSL